MKYAASTRPLRSQRDVPVQARWPTLELHHPGAADPTTFRLPVPQDRPAAGHALDQREIDAHGQIALRAMADHVPTVRAHLGDRFRRPAPILSAPPIQILASHGTRHVP